MPQGTRLWRTCAREVAFVSDREAQETSHPVRPFFPILRPQYDPIDTFIHQVADFLQSVGRKENAAPTFADGLATDYVTDAVLKSARTRQWEKVEGEA